MIQVPKAFIERMQHQPGVALEDFIDALEQPSPVSIRLHHQKGKMSFASNAKVPWCDTGYYLNQRPAFFLDPHWHAGAYYVQEASSMILDDVIRQLNLEAKPRIWLDLCAAPGGKTGILAKHLGPEDVLVANEVVGQRRAILRENLTRAGYRNVFTAGENASSFTFPFADIILIDAPCSGEGMMRKEPEAIHQWNHALVESCSSLQKQIVADAATALLPNGYLIYSTCSYSPDENIKNIEHFIQTQQMQSIALDFPEAWGIIDVSEGNALGYQLFPHRVKGEGLFVAVLKKSSEAEATHKKARKPYKIFELVPKWLESHILDPDGYVLRKNADQNELITKAAEEKANEMLMFLPKATCVLEAGELKGKDFVPSHALSLAGIYHRDYPLVELALDTALDYLERDASSLPPVDANGWYIIWYQGTALGWAKRTAQGWKNHYPMAWRLRDRNRKSS